MPRTRKTMSGAPAQPVGAVPGQEYGMGVEQMQLQQALPAPQAASPVQGTTAPAPQPSAAPAQQAPPPDLSAIAQQLAGQGDLLSGGTQRPNEPITAGLSGGLGPGPEVLQMQRGNPGAQLLRTLSARTGDPYFAELARKAGM